MTGRHLSRDVGDRGDESAADCPAPDRDVPVRAVDLARGFPGVTDDRLREVRRLSKLVESLSATVAVASDDLGRRGPA